MPREPQTGIDTATAVDFRWSDAEPAGADESWDFPRGKSRAVPSAAADTDSGEHDARVALLREQKRATAQQVFAIYAPLTGRHALGRSTDVYGSG